MVLNERITWRGLPRMDLNTLTNATAGFVPFNFSTLDKVTKRNCAVTFTDGYGSAFWPAGAFTTNATIKGRGNYTWTRPKKPFNLTLCGATNFTKAAVNMFGMSTDSDWTLLADYDDFTHIRDLISSAFGFSLGQWASRMIKIELYVNGAYAGLYTFAEKVKQSVERINITALKSGDVTAPNITGGYVFEGEDPTYVAAGEKSFIDARFGGTFSYKVPDATDVVDAQNVYAKGVLDDFLTRLYTVAFNDTTNGYRAVADATTLAQYLLIQDLIKNPDLNSFYLTKDRNGPLKGGPFWDAGTAFALYETAPQNIATDTNVANLRPWLGKLMTDPYFVGIVKQQFATALPKLHQALADLVTFVSRLRGNPTRDGTGHDAIDRDAMLWQNANTDWPGNFDRNTPALITFARARLYWQQRVLYLPPTPQSAVVHA